MNSFYGVEPELTVDSPVQGETYTSNWVPINLYVEDLDCDLDHIEYVTSGNPMGDTVSCNGCSCNFYQNIYFDDGFNNQVYIWVWDQENNVAHRYITFTVNTGGGGGGGSPPSIDISSPYSGQTFTTNEVEFQFNVDDPDNDIDHCEYYLNGMGPNQISCWGDTVHLDNDHYGLDVYVYDSENNYDSDSVWFTVEASGYEGDWIVHVIRALHAQKRLMILIVQK